MESSILSEVDNTSDSQDGLSTRLLLSSQLATNLSALAPAKRAGAQRLCALALLYRPRPTAGTAAIGATTDLKCSSRDFPFVTPTGHRRPAFALMHNIPLT